MNRTNLALAAFTFSTASAFAQTATSGVSHPDEAITVETNAPALVIAPAVVVVPADAVVDPAAPAAPVLKPRTIVAPIAEIRAEPSEDDLIVTSLPARENEIPTGTMLRVRLRQDLSTATTAAGTTLTGELVNAIERDGRVLVPAGSSFLATVSTVHGGKRIRGAAMMHIEPRSFVMPDGTKYPVVATMIDADHFNDNKVDREGNLIRRDHVKQTLAAMSLTTGSAAAAGGVFGGAPGALIGAGVGAGLSTVWWLKQDRQLHLDQGSTLVFQLTSPVLLNNDGKTNGAE